MTGLSTHRAATRVGAAESGFCVRRDASGERPDADAINGAFRRRR
jgi:hypothetical protein